MKSNWHAPSASLSLANQLLILILRIIRRNEQQMESHSALAAIAWLVFDLVG
jgi:hypothetical protein